MNRFPGGLSPTNTAKLDMSPVTMTERSLSPCTEGEFGWRPASSITVGHRAYHRWSRWWARGGTRSLIVHYFSSYLLCLLKVETHTWSQRTCIKHLFLVLLTTLLDWTGLNTKKPKWRVQTERKRQTGTHFFLKKNLEKNDHPPKKTKKIKKCPVIRAKGWVALLLC